jgi:uncharacterized surface protein with fasciclin (FAS1) repeats
MAAALAA